MKVFDSFIFFNELELLEMRLNILNDVVDCFVLTESPFTVSGNEKPLYYQKNKDRFGKFNDKIVHNITEQIPNDFSDYLVKKPFHTDYSSTDESGTRYIDLPIRFQRAVYNRECSAYGLVKAGAQDNDIVMTSDADEIINPYVIENLDWFDPSHNYFALCRAFYFKLNYLYQENWSGTRLCTFKHLKSTTVDRLRTDWRQAYQIENGGWHWSFLGDADNVRLKLASYEHTENNISSNIDNMEQKINDGLDPLGRSNKLKVVPIDDSYPEYILENQKKWAEHIIISPPTKFNKIIIDSSESITELCNLGALYPTDKSPYNKGRGLDGVAYDKHSYTAMYDFIFSTLKYKSINIGEIGIDRNNSMISWRKYFPNATLYGWDLTVDSIENALKDNLENTYYDFMDVRDEQSIIDGLAKPKVKYDILIDDSTHTYEDYIRIVNVAYKFVNIGGILVVEDIKKHISEEDFLKDLPNVRKYFNTITFVETYHKLQGQNHNNDKLLFLIRNDVN